MTSPLTTADAGRQDQLLLGVSRTFALTIPVLPEGLHATVANAYLLCRIVDTIEDEPGLSAEEKRRLSAAFVRVVAGSDDPAAFAADLGGRLTDATIPAEHELIASTPDVIAFTHSLGEGQRRELERCVRIMARGMVRFQELDRRPRGLPDLMALNHYCYCVAGVVGEMLTGLFILEMPELAPKRDHLMALGRSFGQGLQMTNILKDIKEDLRRGACWLPRSVFDARGFDLDDLSVDTVDAAYADGVRHLVGVARTHLENALAYTLHIPGKQTGVRNFCLWALGMAVLTLQKIHAEPCFRTGREVTISRASVRRTVLASRMSVRRDALLRVLFRWAARGLPRVEVRLSDLDPPEEVG